MNNQQPTHGWLSVMKRTKLYGFCNRMNVCLLTDKVNNIKEGEEKLGFPILRLSAFPLVLFAPFS